MAATSSTPRPRGGMVPEGAVLIVGRNLGILDYYREIFVGLGIKALVRSSYEGGLACLESGIFDFILVDQGSRAFEGRRILERAIEINRRVPVLVVTHCRDMGCYLEAMQLGAVDYLEEPISVPEMVRVVTTHLRSLSVKSDN